MLYDLSPQEDIALVEGDLLVVALGDDRNSNVFEAYCLRKIERLSDSYTFQVAIVQECEFPNLKLVQHDLPVVLHFDDGALQETVEGIDDCVEFLDDYIITKRRAH